MIIIECTNSPFTEYIGIYKWNLDSIQIGSSDAQLIIETSSAKKISLRLLGDNVLITPHSDFSIKHNGKKILSPRSLQKGDNIDIDHFKFLLQDFKAEELKNLDSLEKYYLENLKTSQPQLCDFINKL